jgi:hypothetical protein
MKSKTFNVIVVICMLIAVVYPLIIWLSPNHGFLDLRALVAGILAPVLWILGNMISGVLVAFNRYVINKLFYVQCVGSIISIFIMVVGSLYLFAGH